MRYDIAGDPITGLKWSRKAIQKIADELYSNGIKVSANTVAKLLKKMGFSLHVNYKKIESGNRKPTPKKKRNHQFEYISQQRDEFSLHGNPVISVDTKKKELIGNFKNPGRTWGQKAIEVNDHDFHVDSLGIAILYGVYDTQGNSGCMYIGTTCDTPRFAVDCIESWWQNIGCMRYPHAENLLILADCGGSNGYRSRVWKYKIHQLSQRYNLTVHVCHYPPGASKWNPIEHRLFSEISKNWAGEPLVSYETVINHICTTKTSTGLTVQAEMIGKTYQKGERISDQEMDKILIRRYEELQEWNYILEPLKM